MEIPISLVYSIDYVKQNMKKLNTRKAEKQLKLNKSLTPTDTVKANFNTSARNGECRWWRKRFFPWTGTNTTGMMDQIFHKQRLVNGQRQLLNL
jgi:hypothetical protein